MTQPVLFAVEDGAYSPVTNGAVVELEPENNSVRKGAIVERLFEIAALQKGYEIAVNIGGGKDFDCIIRRPGERPIVVQIKTVFWDAKLGRYYIPNASRATGLYSAEAYDVLAAFLPDRHQWLFYLRSELGNRTGTSFTPRELRQKTRRSYNGKHGETMADRDPENWDLLDDVAESLTFSGPTPADV